MRKLLFLFATICWTISLIVIIWDGRTTSGEPCTDGVYFYVLKYANAKGEQQNKKEYISLFK